MPKLFIIRHAIAEDREDFKTSGLPDEQRPLTHDGQKKMKKISDFLYERQPDIELFIQSPLTRSQQTVDILKKNYEKARVITTPHLAPLSPFAELCKVLKDHEKKNFAIIGHEDHLSHFTCYLLTGKRSGTFLKYKKGGIAALEFHKHIEPGSGHLLWFLTPKMMGV